MTVENTQTEAVETTETETVETTETEVTPETTTTETEVTPEVETEETTTETTTTETEETVETPEETEPEKETEPEQEETPAETDESKTELANLTTKYKAEQKKVTDLKSQVTSLEGVVKGILDTKMELIPKEYKELLPDGDLVKQLEWINKAEKSGLFNKKEVSDVEIGKPLNLGNPKEKANSNSTAQQKLSNYFSNKYSK